MYVNVKQRLSDNTGAGEWREKEVGSWTRKHTEDDGMICQQRQELVRPVGPLPLIFSMTTKGLREL